MEFKPVATWHKWMGQKWTQTHEALWFSPRIMCQTPSMHTQNNKPFSKWILANWLLILSCSLGEASEWNAHSCNSYKAPKSYHTLLVTWVLSSSASKPWVDLGVKPNVTITYVIACNLGVASLRHSLCHLIVVKSSFEDLDYMKVHPHPNW